MLSMQKICKRCSFKIDLQPLSSYLPKEVRGVKYDLDEEPDNEN